MKKNNYRNMVTYTCLAILFLGYAVPIESWPPAKAEDVETNTNTGGLDALQEAIGASDDAKAVQISEAILRRLEAQFRANAGFNSYKSKLNAAVFLARQMEMQLKKATNRKMITTTSEVLGNEKRNERQNNEPTVLSVAPAKSFYETSVKLFSKPIRMEGLKPEEKDFLARYYDLKLRLLVRNIAQAGQALALAEPQFKGTYDYVLVLPLLHASEEKPVNINILPKWTRGPEQLSTLSDSCLLHFGFPFHAMVLARESVRLQSGQFSEIDFYKSAAERCKRGLSHVAVDCLLRTMKLIPKENSRNIVDLYFQIVNVWLDSGNYALAAAQARKIFEAYPDYEDVGKAMWLYHYALSRSNRIDEVLAHIDTALAEHRCVQYRPKLMYIKWWALRRKRSETARVAALEYQILKEYGENPMIAPILLSRATDLLARQDYAGAQGTLAYLVETFPSTKAAGQAKRILTKLQSIRQAH